MQSSKITKKDKIGITAVVALVLLFASASWFFSQRWIIAISDTDSVSDHILVVDKLDKNVTKGDIVGFYYRGKPMHGYKNGSKFIKYIVCDEGDLLTVKNRKYYCNGEFIAEAIKINSFGEPVTDIFEYNGTIPEGKFFAWTPFYYSYDSRYWGFVDKRDLIGKGFGIF